jgi:excisionase family DNA binding protein
MPEASLFSTLIGDVSAAADISLVPKILYSRKEAAYAMSVSCRSLDNWIAEGELKVRRIRGRVLVHRSELEKFAERDHALPGRAQ